MVICALKTVICWIILQLVGTNLVGFFVRGLHMVRPLQKATKRVNELMPGLRKMDTTGFSGMVQRTLRWNSFVNIVAGIACIAYPLILFWWLGWQVSTAALILMLARLPDLIFELKTGIKVNRKNAPNKPIYIIATGLTWLTLALVWWGICYVPKDASGEGSRSYLNHENIKINADSFFIGFSNYMKAVELIPSFTRGNFEDYKKIIALLDESKKRLSKCDIRLLNEIYYGWGDILNDKFIPSIEMTINYTQQKLSESDLIKANAMEVEVGQWFDINMGPLVKILNNKYGYPIEYDGQYIQRPK